MLAEAPAWASPGVFEPLSASASTGSKVNLGLDGRMAGRLLADDDRTALRLEDGREAFRLAIGERVDEDRDRRRLQPVT